MSLCSFCGRNTFSPRVSVDFPALYNRLCSESGPTSVQPDEVATILENVRRDLQDYETDDHRLRSCRLRTTEKQERLRTYATQVQSLLSPIRKVPDEILQYIFDVCCDTNTFDFFQSLYGEEASWTLRGLRGKPAIVISSVCLRWRRNALSLPAIWSRITVYWNWGYTGEIRDDHELNNHLELFSPLYNFIERSQQSPMTIDLAINEYPFLQKKPKVLHPCIKHLLAQFSRCQFLTITGGLCGISTIIQDLSSVSFPILNTLHIMDEIEPRELALFADTAPLLRELKVPFLDLSWDFPFSQLSHMDFCLIYHTNDIANVFDRCSKLSSMEIEDTWSAPTCPAPIISRSSRLDILTICHEEWNGDSHGPYPNTSILPLLEFPSLKILHLKKKPQDDDLDPVDQIWTNFGPFIDFVRRSSFPLTTLSIQSLPFSDSNLVELLILLPTLRDFTLDDRDIPPQFSPISSKFIESLHSNRSSSLRPQLTPLIPRLKSLRLLNVSADSAMTFNDTSVVEMVQSRWIPDKLCTTGTSAFDVDCLRVFTMVFQNRLKEEAGDVYDCLNDIERSGMMIVVYWCNAE